MISSGAGSSLASRNNTQLLSVLAARRSLLHNRSGAGNTGMLISTPSWPISSISATISDQIGLMSIRIRVPHLPPSLLQFHTNEECTTTLSSRPCASAIARKISPCAARPSACEGAPFLRRRDDEDLIIISRPRLPA